MIENTYGEIGAFIGVIIATALGTLKFVNGNKNNKSKIDASKYVEKADCKDEHKEVKEYMKENREQHREMLDNINKTGLHVATLLERTKPK